MGARENKRNVKFFNEKKKKRVAGGGGRGGGEGVLPKVRYTGRLRPKGVPFFSSQYIKRYRKFPF